MQPVGIDRIGQINIPVKQMDRAVAFYRDVLGLKFLFQVPNLAFFDCGGVRILLDFPQLAEFQHPSSVVYFNVPDIRAAYAALQANGAETIQEPHVIAKLENREVWMAFFRDSEENVHALMSEVAV